MFSVICHKDGKDGHGLELEAWVVRAGVVHITMVILSTEISVYKANAAIGLRNEKRPV